MSTCAGGSDDTSRKPASGFASTARGGTRRSAPRSVDFTIRTGKAISPVVATSRIREKLRIAQPGTFLAGTAPASRLYLRQQNSSE